MRPSLLAFALAAALAPASTALAADYDPPIYVDQAPEYRPVEVGSGWYLRGDIGYTFESPYRNDDFPAATGGTYNEDYSPVFGSIGMGYHFNDYLRGEFNVGRLATGSTSLTFATRDPLDGTLLSTVSQGTDNELWTGMVNGYADLGTYVGFTPYIGAGIGLVYNKRGYTVTEDFADVATADTSFVDTKRHYDWAYSLGAGINYAITRNLSLDLGYEYFSSPGAEYAELTGPGTYTVKEGVDFHQVKVGLRYELW